MKNTYVGIFIQDNGIQEVITDINKEEIIKRMKEIVSEVFDEDEDNAYVYLNNQLIWSYEE